MTKEEYAYELIDKWLYLVSQRCVIMENYRQRDWSVMYEDCTRKLGFCFEYYDQVYRKVDREKFSEEQIDSKLVFLIQKLRNETLKAIVTDIEELCRNIDEQEIFIKNNLLYDKRGREQEITKEALINFITQLRKKEEE